MASPPTLPLRGKRRLWIVIFVGSLFFIGIPFFVLVPPRAPPDPSTLWILVISGAAMAVASFVAPARLERSALRSLPPLVEGESEEKDAVRRRLIAIQSFMLSLALSDAVAFTGLGVRAVGLPSVAAVPFFAVGTLLMLLRFPREQSPPRA